MGKNKTENMQVDLQAESQILETKLEMVIRGNLICVEYQHLCTSLFSKILSLDAINLSQIIYTVE